MEKSLVDKIMEAKDGQRLAHKIFFNDGTIGTEKKWYADKVNSVNTPSEIRSIEYIMSSAAECYSRDGDFDTLNMKLRLGLIYNYEDTDENNRIWPNAKPVDNVVQYYTSTINSYLDGEQTNTFDYDAHMPTYQGYIEFDKLVANYQDGDVVYDGPQTFDEFKEKILSGEHFDISLTVKLKKQEEVKHYVRVKK